VEELDRFGLLVDMLTLSRHQPILLYFDMLYTVMVQKLGSVHAIVNLVLLSIKYTNDCLMQLEVKTSFPMDNCHVASLG
jgi:hypothetical protein